MAINALWYNLLFRFNTGRLEACCLSYGRVATRLNGTKVPTAVLYTSRKEKYASLGVLVIVVQSFYSPNKRKNSASSRIVIPSV
jgi:hypothetical protein